MRTTSENQDLLTRVEWQGVDLSIVRGEERFHTVISVSN